MGVTHRRRAAKFPETIAKAPIERVAAFARDKGWKHIRLQWASELLFEPPDSGQDMRHLGTGEPLWTLLDLTPGGRPNADEQIESACCDAPAKRGSASHVIR